MSHRGATDGEPTVFLPGATVGLLGSGQLGRMTAIAARHMGYRVACMGPNASDPCAPVSDTFVEGSLSDVEAAARLAAEAHVVTLETENVAFEVMAALERERPARPSAAVLAVTRDRIAEKETMTRLGIPVAPFAPVEHASDLQDALDKVGVPCLLKTARGGYDGKGQVRIGSRDEAFRGFTRLGGGEIPLIAEAIVPFSKELSVVASRSVDGRIACFPVCENEHVGGILHRTIAPAGVPAAVQSKAGDLASQIVKCLDVVGTLAVEMFFIAPDRLLVNELAPRPHNSGHYTLDACATSQFEQHVRAVCGLPLGSTTQWAPAVMLNILGEHMPTVVKNAGRLLSEPRLKLHLYGKSEARAGRKMGHLTVLGDTPDDALEAAARAWKLIESRG